MADKPPTLRERAIATSPKNAAALRDLIIDIAEIIDKMERDALPLDPNENLAPQTQNNESP